MRARHQYEEAIPQYETALARNPNMAYPLHALGECKLMQQLALRLSIGTLPNNVAAV